MAADQTHEDHVRGNLAVVEHVVRRLTERDRHPPERTCLNAVKRAKKWLDGGRVTVAQLGAAATAAHNRGFEFRGSRDREGRAWAKACFAAGNLCWMACKERGWKDADRSILDHAVSALGTVGAGGRRRQIQKMQREGRLASSKRRVNETVVVDRDVVKRGERLSANHLDPLVATRLRRLDARIDARFVSDRDGLVAALRARRTRPTTAIHAFEKRYGGLELNLGSKDDAPEYFFGVHRCTEVDTPRRGLVPIGFSGNDIYWYMDPRGAVWSDDLEYPLDVFAPNGDVTISRMVLNTIVWDRRAQRKVAERDGRHGRRVAKELSLPAVRKTHDRTWRAWGDARRLVIQHDRIDGSGPVTIFAGQGAARFRRELD